jgi:hypothetical protein
MEHRGFEFSVVQALGRNLWRWYLTINDAWLSGEAQTQQAAVAEAQKAIDRAITLGASANIPE